MPNRNGYITAFAATAIASALGAGLVMLVLRPMANAVHARPGAKFTGAVLRNGPALKELIAGCINHSWELLGMWAWAPAFVAACVIAGKGRNG